MVLLSSGESRAEAWPIFIGGTPSTTPFKLFDETDALTLGFGGSRQRRTADGYYGRLGYRSTVEDLPSSKFSIGGWVGGEGWWTKGDGWGLGVPVELAIGPATDHMRIMATGGVSLVSVDRERDQTGVGIFSPRGGLVMGVEFEPVRLLLDARAIYRWHFNAPATPQVQLGLSLEFFTRSR